MLCPDVSTLLRMSCSACSLNYLVNFHPIIISSLVLISLFAFISTSDNFWGGFTVTNPWNKTLHFSVSADAAVTLTELSDGVWCQNTCALEELHEFPPIGKTIASCLWKEHLEELIWHQFSRPNRLEVISPPRVSAQHVVLLIALLDPQLFVICRFSLVLLTGASSSAY